MEFESHLKPGTLLHHNSYRIERVLGQGGFGITYLAKHTVLNKFVAIKEFFPKTFCYRDTTTNTISTPSTSNTVLVERLKKKFIKEAEHIGKFDSPYIVKIIDVFEENQTAYYIMDYIEGMSLSDLVKANGPLTESRAIEYVLKVGHALTYIHSEKLNHLDVKPANIMLRTKNDTPLLVDFGLSKQYDSEGHQTSTTPVGISHGFAPMEQYKEGGVREFSPQTDLYSLAATLYYLLTGIVPPQAILMIDEQLSFPDGFPERLIPIIGQAMSTKRSDRQPTVEIFCRQLMGDASAGEETEIIKSTIPLKDTPKNGHKNKVNGENLDRYKLPQQKSKKQPSLEDHQKRKKKIEKHIKIAAIGVGSVYIGWILYGAVLWYNKKSGVEYFKSSGNINGYDYVDLGLPSGLKWAGLNIGATHFSKDGSYFCWGAISSPSPDTLKNNYSLHLLDDISGNINYDAACKNWGATWRMPTKSEWEELKDECKWDWKEGSKFTGYKVTGPNGNWIFLPIRFASYGDSGYYWTSTPSDSENYAHDCFFEEARITIGGDDWSQELCIRPVSD